MQEAYRTATPRLSSHWLAQEEADQWDSFVTQHPLGSVYHLSAWKRVMEEAFPHIQGRILTLRDDTGEICAGLPIYTVSSWLLGTRIVSVPFAAVCDPLISSTEEFRRLLPHIKHLQRTTHSRRAEIRARKTARSVEETCALAPHMGFKHHYILLNKDRDALFRTFSRTSVRKNITNAQKAGVVVEERDDEASLKTFHAILTLTRRQLALPPIPFAFFRAMRRHLWPQHLKLFLAFQKGTAVGCLLMLRLGGFWVAEYVGDTEQAHPGVDESLYWASMRAALDHGGEVYSFGRTATANQGLRTYKRHWGTVEEDLSEFIFSAPNRSADPVSKVHHSDQSLVYRMARLIVGRMPLPIYRAFGDLCYRHLG